MKNRAPPPPPGVAPLRSPRSAEADRAGAIPSDKAVAAVAAAALSSDKSDSPPAIKAASGKPPAEKGATLPATKAGSPPLERGGTLSLAKGGTLPSRGKAAAPKPPLVARGQNVSCCEVEFSVILPSGQLHSATSEKRIPIMDVLVRLCAWYRLSPARHALELYSRVDGRPLPFKPNTAIGSLPVGAVRLVEREPLDARRAHRSNAPEPTVRLVVNLSRTQKEFLRVSRRVPLRVLLPAIAAKSGLEPRSLLLFRDATQAERVDLACSLAELGIRELYVVDTSKATARCHPIVHGSHTYPGARRQPPPPPGVTEHAGKENAGIFSCLRPRKKKMVHHSVPASPAPVLAAAAAPRRRSLESDAPKKRRAPAPPLVAATLPRAASSARPRAAPARPERPRSRSLPGADSVAPEASGDGGADGGGAKKKKRAAPQPQGQPKERPQVLPQVQEQPQVQVQPQEQPQEQPQVQPQVQVQVQPQEQPQVQPKVHEQPQVQVLPTVQPKGQPKPQGQPQSQDQCHGQPKGRAHPRTQLVIVSGLEVTVIKDSHPEKRGRCDGEACGEADERRRCKEGDRGDNEQAQKTECGHGERAAGGGDDDAGPQADGGAGAGGDAAPVRVVPVRVVPSSPEKGTGHTVTWADVKVAEAVAALPYIDSGYEQEELSEAFPSISAHGPALEDGETGGGRRAAGAPAGPAASPSSPPSEGRPPRQVFDINQAS
ncbi:protein cordon-bleu-like [Lethenteron reissneri]|uniref:protein cordon-bleu-like n=1 Tax=Lethenteron reissneri TaxID=7753 RepID=UPI002AB60AF4|nr:protein cordon-bleu-like [Lethenteron reissneri]